jgi:UPF0288 family protein (methanogenesis marker protein 3)
MGSMNNPWVLSVRSFGFDEGIVALPRPNKCGSEEHSIMGCRDDAIRMEWLPLARNETVGLWR